MLNYNEREQQKIIPNRSLLCWGRIFKLGSFWRFIFGGLRLYGNAAIPAAEHAALTATCLALYNLDAAVTRD